MSTLFGLTPAAMAKFGISGDAATSYFGVQAVQEFVTDYFNFGSGVVVSGNTADLFEQAQQYDAALNLGDGAGAYAALQEVDATLRSSIGKGITDISFSVDGNGNVTGSLNGVDGATSTLNLGELFAQAQSQIETSGALNGVDTSALNGLFGSYFGDLA